MKTKSLPSLAVMILAAALLVHPRLVFAQNNNPTGPAGVFNGNSTVGGSYDPFTANATRTIPDITVAATVGSYPMVWARTMNSRGIGGLFGAGGGWRHSYQWTIQNSEIFYSFDPGTPSRYNVSFPDGRVINFAYSSIDPAYRGLLGVQERFQGINTSTGWGYLLLPDGGKVEFYARAKRYRDADTGLYNSWWTYQATAIIDPSGLRTSLIYNADGTLSRVTEPAGRWLQVYYASGRISAVNATPPSAVTTPS